MQQLEDPEKVIEQAVTDMQADLIKVETRPITTQNLEGYKATAPTVWSQSVTFISGMSIFFEV